MNSCVFSPIATVSQRPVRAVYLSKHFERMVCSKELAEFECGAIIGFHHCNKSVSSSSSRNQVSSLLDILQLSVNGILEPQQLPSVRTQKVTERGHWVTV